MSITALNGLGDVSGVISIKEKPNRSAMYLILKYWHRHSHTRRTSWNPLFPSFISRRDHKKRPSAVIPVTTLLSVDFHIDYPLYLSWSCGGRCWSPAWQRAARFVVELVPMHPAFAWLAGRLLYYQSGCTLPFAHQPAHSPQRREHSMCNRFRFWGRLEEIRITNLTSSLGFKLPF